MAVIRMLAAPRRKCGPASPFPQAKAPHIMNSSQTGVSSVSDRIQAPRLDREALLEAMVQAAAILGTDGRVVAVNQAWRDLAEHDELAAFSLGTGSARTSGCDCGQQDGCELSEAATESIVKVIFGKVRAACATASCEATGNPRWFRIDVGSLAAGVDAGALIVCTEVTEYKQARRRATRPERLQA